MYKKHFGFTQKPFSIIPNPDFLYLSPKHQNALTYLQYGIMERIGFVLLTGEIGIGKTTLIRYLLNQVEADLDIAIIFNTNITPSQLILLLMQELEITPVSDEKTKNIETIYRFLVNKYAAGRKVLLIIDEAQNLSDDVLEEVRMLSNFHSDDEIFLQIMLVGQPELRAKLNSAGLKQLSQRIAVNYHLSALVDDEVREYIRVRLEKAGCDKEIFYPTAVDRIIAASGGIPRTINIICDTSLVYAYGEGAFKVNADIVEQVVQDNAGLWEADDEPTGGIADAISETSLNELYARIETLEGQFAELNRNVVGQLEKFNKRAIEHSRNLLIKKLTAMITKERRISDTYLKKYIALREKYLKN